MMDHARHLSSPSPTSPFLFHHSDRSYNSSNPLTPLLSSAADVTSVDDCFSSTSPNISHSNHNPFGVDHHQLVDNHHHHHSHHTHHHHNHHHHHNQQTHHRRHNSSCVIDPDSLTDVDDDGMHNMLSGSSTSSNSTMPLLTESHSHHSFSRISLEEYSPLSLVEDCDNALTISPTSLACGSHHSFKSSLNGLKMDNLVGDVDVHDHDDDVNDARSLSPSLVSSHANNHNNLWSTSSTAITQSTSLLNSTSTSFLLSQHHHNQLNSFIQQLEPQSLDEAPPVTNQSNNFDSNASSLNNRPSSEPPPGSGHELNDVETKSVSSQAGVPKGNQSTKSGNKNNSSFTSLSSPASRSRKSRSRSSAVKQNNVTNLAENKQNTGTSASTTQEVETHSSKLHLQLNHHKKLQELQKRLFGPAASSESANLMIQDSKNQNDLKSLLSASKDDNMTSSVKDEPDSSACNRVMPAISVKISNRARARPSRSRKSRLEKDPAGTSMSNHARKVVERVVTTETAEPDTTTVSADCTKSTDISSESTDRNNNNFVANDIASNVEASDADNCEKRVQQIQLQVSPSLTVVANNGLVQPVTIQQQGPGGAVITTSNATFSNQILCRAHNVSTTSAGQLKMSNEPKSGDTAITNWSIQTNNGGNGNQNCNTNNSINISNGQTISGHQIAIQVICQDGTSLVLPVSSAASLNAAVSLTSQHQQLQAVLTGNTTNRSNNGQLLPLMSVSNIVAQQQPGNQNETSSTMISNSSSQNTSSQTSGLAASSPTLAALLDACPSRNNNETTNSSTNFSGQNFVPTNLLRKLVSGNTSDFKRTELTIQPGSNLSLANCGSLVTVCATGNVGTGNKIVNVNSNSSSEKRIKLENVDGNNMQKTFTLIDPQGLLVANGNDKALKNTVQTSSNAATINGSVLNNATTKMPSSETTKQSKIGSSTGNRQVDPTQPFRCEHCNSTFTRLGNFTRHKKIHTVPTKDGQRFKCDVCSKSFLQRCDLARHLHIHRGTEPHRCNICGKGYIRHSDLVTHQRFHNKEKPFGCPHCSKGFCQRGDLNRHLRSIHLQMKPILCPCCNRKFAKQETLLRHLNSAHRSKPGSASGVSIVTELPSNTYNTNQGDDKQQNTMTVVNTAVLNNDKAQKNASVVSLQAIQATLCKSQSLDPSTTTNLKTVSLSEQQEKTSKAS